VRAESPAAAAASPPATTSDLTTVSLRHHLAARTCGVGNRNTATRRGRCPSPRAPATTANQPTKRQSDKISSAGEGERRRVDKIVGGLRACVRRRGRCEWWGGTCVRRPARPHSWLSLLGLIDAQAQMDEMLWIVPFSRGFLEVLNFILCQDTYT
jgi:hypothetical protein